MRRSPLEQTAAKAVTGPAGHLLGGVIDWVALLLHYAWSRARGRDPWA